MSSHVPRAVQPLTVACLPPYKLPKRKRAESFTESLQKNSAIVSLFGLLLSTGAVLWRAGGLEASLEGSLDRVEKRLDKIDDRLDRVLMKALRLP